MSQQQLPPQNTSLDEGGGLSFLQSPDCEKNLRKFIDSNLLPILRCKLTGEITECNEAAARLLGYSFEELNSGDMNTAPFTSPEYVQLDQVGLEQVRTTGKTDPFDKQLLKKDGSRCDVLVLAVCAATEPEMELLAFIIDRTNQKNIEAELKASEAQFKLLAEAIPHLVWICDREGKTTYINDRFFDVTGLKRQDDNGFLWLKAIHPADRRKLRTEALHAARLGEPFEIRVRYLCKDGESRWHMVRALPARTPDDDLQWYGTSTDIDYKVRLQERTLRSETYFRTMANAIPQIVWTANAHGEIDFFNHRWFEYTGLSVDESQNGGWQFLIHPGDRKQYLKEWKQALATGDSYEMEFRLRRAQQKSATDPGGTAADPYRWHLGRAVALRNSEGKILKWFATWTEIEDQVRKEPQG
jgi:PAS domain S-box-containing protein